SRRSPRGCGRHSGGGLPARGMRILCRRTQVGGHGPDLPACTHVHAGEDAAGGARCQRLCLLRLAQGRHRRRPPGHGGGGADAAADPRTREGPGGGRLRHPGRRGGPSSRQGGRCSGHRHPDHPVDRRPAARAGRGRSERLSARSAHGARRI
ncbi:MAG: Tryptophan synthase alpha chain, partial [uncultured Ramlibacter sp.]